MLKVFVQYFFCLGFRNSKLGFLRRQHNYFLLDGITHMINLLLHSPKNVGIVIYCMWMYAVVIHLYYYVTLKTNPPPRRNQDGKTEEDNAHKIPRIFHWSCVEYQSNRFSIFESGKEIFETTLDVVAHTTGFILGFRMIESNWYKIGALIVMCGAFYQRMLGFKYFLTEPKMMPPQLRRFFTDYSSKAMTD
jgi:hypothetical protein